MEYTPEEFAAFLMEAAGEAPRATVQVVRKGSSNVKTSARRHVRQTAPLHNAHAHAFINFDVEAKGVLVEGEIGYDKGGPGDLGNLLEFGGGGDHSPPHRDLARALEIEDSRFEQGMGDMGAKLLGE